MTVSGVTEWCEQLAPRGSGRIGFGAGGGGRGPLQPVGTEDFDGVLGAHGAVAAIEVVGRAILVAAPADALGIPGMQGDFGHRAYLWSPEFQGQRQVRTARRWGL